MLCGQPESSTEYSGWECSFMSSRAGLWPNLNLSNGALRANSGEIVGLMSLQGCNPHLEHPNALRTLLFDQQSCVVLFFRSAGRGSLETVCICIYIYKRHTCRRCSYKHQCTTAGGNSTLRTLLLEKCVCDSLILTKRVGHFNTLAGLLPEDT